MARDLDTRVIHEAHPDYPIEARAMARPPRCLYVRGALPTRPGVAVVGTRRACPPACRFARELGQDLGSAGIAVWSGGASGVDAAAHQGAVDAGAPSVVVMGTGFDHPYPAANAALFEQVLETGGAWLSLWPDAQPGTRWTFLVRNELLAALVRGVVVVQAPVRSGARSTAAAARRLGRPVWAVPGAPWDPLGAGCAQELTLGAEPLRSAAEVARACGLTWNPQPHRRGDPDGPGDPLRGLSDTEAAVARAVGSSPLHPDDICEETGLAASAVAGALLTLTLRHVLVLGSDGRYFSARS
jgi:DNA processing protein